MGHMIGSLPKKQPGKPARMAEASQSCAAALVFTPGKPCEPRLGLEGLSNPQFTELVRGPTSGVYTYRRELWVFHSSGRRSGQGGVV